MHDRTDDSNEIDSILRRRRHRFTPTEAAALRAWLRGLGWLPDDRDGTYWAPPGVAREHGDGGTAPREWCDYLLADAARARR